jgi:putative membrane protein
MGARAIVTALAFSGVVNSMRAHETDAANANGGIPWELDPWALVMLAITAAWYALGLRRMPRNRVHTGTRRWETVMFAAGWFTLVLALLSPIHALGHESFAVHMVQHELLMIAAAPLLVLGRPLVVFLRALPARNVRSALEFFRRSQLAALWRWMMIPSVATLVHAAALWMWHIPAWFDASVTYTAVHALQHASFLGSALIFWESLLFGRQRRAGYGIAVVYLFVTAVHSGLLGAILTFAPRVIYAMYAEGPGRWSLTALEDQQLGGLVMWVPAGMAYVAAGLSVFAAWLRDAELRPAKMRKA